jgi:hypothetical protein
MHLLFPGQQDDEKIITVAREHWFYLSAKIAAWFVFILVLFAFDYFVKTYFPNLLEDPYVTYVALAKNIYMMFVMLGLLNIIILHYLNIWIVTNKRVVDITQGGIFNQRISELTLPNIEDITSQTTGFFGTLLSFGNVEIQTAGKRENFLIERVPTPKNIERLIFNLMDDMTNQQRENP